MTGVSRGPLPSNLGAAFAACLSPVIGTACRDGDGGGPSMMKTTAPPAGGRLEGLDATRGIAVLGIVFANVIGFGQPIMATLWPGHALEPPGPLTPWLWAAQLVLVDGKFRGLFTLLFGASLALFAERAAARAGEGDVGATALQLRRLAWLFVFGLAHFYLLWRGDILTLYAIAGALMLPLLGWSNRALLSTGLAVTVVAELLLVLSLLAATVLTGGSPETLVANDGDAAREAAIAALGSYADYVRHGFSAHVTDWIDQLFFLVTETLPLMMVGVAFYRMGLFGPDRASVRQRRWAWVGVLVGAALTAAVAIAAVREGLSESVATLAMFTGSGLLRLPMTLGLAVLLPHLASRGGGALVRAFTAAGRMAFSNYIGTSVLMLLIFQPPGFRLFGELDRPALYAIAILVAAVMLLWSPAWLRRFRQGPLEWLWRCLTYGKLLPLRR